MEEYITFNKTNNNFICKINPEKAYFKITRIEIPSIPKNSKNILSLVSDISFIYKVFKGEQQTNTKPIDNLGFYIKENQFNAKFDINEVVNDDSTQTLINIEYKSERDNDEDVIVYFTKYKTLIELKNSSEDFNTHINHSDNIKILFSAPFGQGKTTFLNHYFKAHNDSYEVFRLFPVNYAVSHNEDIFKYIKAEILFQLMGKDVEFDKIEFNYSDTAYSYYSQNIDKIISPLLSLLPKIGETAAKVFDKIYDIAQTLKKHKSALDIDDKKAALKYIHDLYEKEGSIFEDNFYTQLIRQLLEQHKAKYHKKNVLIIDDIDRMDPEHIFRIFNVFSANFDSLEYNNGGLSNKFAFDKIILVCDLENIKKLFLHRYGNSSAFDGYLSKYYSITPYYFDNSKEIELITKKIVYGTRQNFTFLEDAFLLILNDLISTKQISLRDLLRLQRYNFYDKVTQLSSQYSDVYKSHKHKFLYFNIIGYLNNIYDLETIKEKLRICKTHVRYKTNYNYNYYTEIGLVPLTTKPNERINKTTVNFQNISYNFIINETTDRGNWRFEYFEVKDIERSGINTLPSFNQKDFYEALGLNVDKFNES